MKFLADYHRIFEQLCKYKKKWGLLISFESPNNSNYNDFQGYLKELKKAAPYLTTEILCSQDVLEYGKVIFFFNTQKEMNRYFNLTVGDDGPTKTNKYKGKCHVYALTCDPRGQCLNENT